MLSSKKQKESTVLVERVTLEQVLAEHALHQHETFHKKREQRDVDAKRNFRKHKLPEISNSGVVGGNHSNSAIDGSGVGGGTARSRILQDKALQQERDADFVSGRGRKSPTTEWYASKYHNEPPFPHFNFSKPLVPTASTTTATSHQNGNSKSKSVASSSSSNQQKQQQLQQRSISPTQVGMKDVAKEWVSEFGSSPESGNNKSKSIAKKRQFENPNEFVFPIDSRPYAKIISEQPHWNHLHVHEGIQLSPPIISARQQQQNQFRVSPVGSNDTKGHSNNNNVALHNSGRSLILAPLQPNSLSATATNNTTNSPRDLSKVYYSTRYEPLGATSMAMVAKKKQRQLKEQQKSKSSVSPESHKNQNSVSSSVSSSHQQEQNSSKKTPVGAKNQQLLQKKRKESKEKVEEEEEDSSPVNLADLEKQVQHSLKQSQNRIDQKKQESNNQDEGGDEEL